MPFGHVHVLQEFSEDSLAGHCERSKNIQNKRDQWLVAGQVRSLVPDAFERRMKPLDLKLEPRRGRYGNLAETGSRVLDLHERQGSWFLVFYSPKRVKNP